MVGGFVVDEVSSLLHPVNATMISKHPVKKDLYFILKSKVRKNGESSGIGN